MSKQDREQLYMNYLLEEGYRPHVGDNGLISFKSQGMTYFIVVDENDEIFFRIVVPNFWSIETDDERRRAQAAADDSSGSTKVAKVFTVDNNVWAAYESFFAMPDHFRGVFSRGLSALNTAVQNFADKMRG